MKKTICMAIIFTAMFTLIACGNSKNTNTQTENITLLETTKVNAEMQSEVQMKYISVTNEQGNEIIFSLNNSSLANSFYKQLPLTVNVENYGSDEKIFYSPEKLDITNGVHDSGILNYYAPWGNVFMLYGTHAENKTFENISGVYTLGDVVSGREFIEDLTGEIKIETTEYDIDKKDNTKMKVEVGGSTFSATLENNVAVEALIEMMKDKPVVIQMKDYSGFEKVGALGKNIPTNNSQITTSSGDIVLYQGNQIVIFYGSNSWSYTKIGKIDELNGWKKALGSGDITVTFSLDD